MRLNFFEYRTLFWSTNRQFWFDLVHFLWASSTWARVGDKIKKLGGASHFGHVFTDFQKKYPCSMRLNFFEHRTLIWSTNRQFWFDLAHFLWASSTWAIVRDNIKTIGHSEPFWTRFYRFSKKYPRSMRLNFFEHWTLFWSLNRQFPSDLAHFLWTSSTWAIVGDKVEKIGQSEPFWTRFYHFSKKYPRSMRLNFFEHWTLFWSLNRPFLSDLAHFLWASSTWAIVGDKIKKNGQSEPFWTRFYRFSKKYPCSMRLNFFEHRTLFWSTNRQFGLIWFIFCGQAPREPDLGIK